MSILVPILDEVDPSYTVIIRRLHSFFRGLDQVDKLFFAQLVVVDPELPAEHAGLLLLGASLVAHGCFQLLTYRVGWFDFVGGIRILFMWLSNIRDDLV